MPGFRERPENLPSRYGPRRLQMFKLKAGPSGIRRPRDSTSLG